MTRRRRRRQCPTFWRLACLIALASGLIVARRDARADERIPDGSFGSGKGAWFAYGVASGPDLVDGALCVKTKEGTVNPWDAAIGRNDLPIQAQGYRLTFRARASKDVVPNANFQHASGGYEVIAGGNPTVTTGWKTFT